MLSEKADSKAIKNKMYLDIWSGEIGDFDYWQSGDFNKVYTGELVEVEPVGFSDDLIIWEIK